MFIRFSVSPKAIRCQPTPTSPLTNFGNSRLRIRFRPFVRFAEGNPLSTHLHLPTHQLRQQQIAIFHFSLVKRTRVMAVDGFPPQIVEQSHSGLLQGFFGVQGCHKLIFT